MLSGMWVGDLEDSCYEEQSYCSEDLMFIIFKSTEFNGLDHLRIAYTAGVHKAAFLHNTTTISGMEWRGDWRSGFDIVLDWRLVCVIFQGKELGLVSKWLS